jgi:hypothetical protein
MKKVTKQGQIGNLQGFILSIVGVAVVLAVGLIVLAELQGTQVTGAAGCNATDTSSCGGAYDATGTVITKLGTVPTWIGILIVVALAFIVLSFFGGRR